MIVTNNKRFEEREEFIKYLAEDLSDTLLADELSEDELLNKVKWIYTYGWKAGYFDCNAIMQDLRLKGKL